MRILDLFCGAGGAAMGLHQAFPEAEIYGIDIEPQPHYPFKFSQGDVKTFALECVAVDLVWASPPCQHYTQMLNHGMTDRTKHPDLIPFVRAMLKHRRIPYVIENVAGAPLMDAVILCGTMFGLQTLRHRLFECSFHVTPPLHPRHEGHGIRNQRDGGQYYRCYGHETGKRQWGAAMGIDWMKTQELAQAIPPAYSRYIGNQFKESVECT